jgi:hypothetical protein
MFMLGCEDSLLGRFPKGGQATVYLGKAEGSGELQVLKVFVQNAGGGSISIDIGLEKVECDYLVKYNKIINLGSEL